jgi:hypothetical protein
MFFFFCPYQKNYDRRKKEKYYTDYNRSHQIFIKRIKGQKINSELGKLFRRRTLRIIIVKQIIEKEDKILTNNMDKVEKDSNHL